MKCRIIVLSIALVCAAAAGATAQVDTLSLTLQECIGLAQAKGPLGVMARSRYERSTSSYRSFAATFYPQLSLEGDVPGYTRAITSVVLSDGSTIFTPQSQASASLGLGLTQKIPFTGGTLSLSSGINRIDLLESKTQYYKSQPLSLTLSQPLFQINTMRWDREAQELSYRMAPRALAEALEDCAIDITGKFFTLLMASITTNNAAVNLAINDTLYRISRGRFNVGKIAENDLLQSELAYLSAKTQLENASVGLERATQDLRAALGIENPAAIAVVPPTDIPALLVEPAEVLAHARRYRSDILDFQLQLINAERAVRQAKSDNSLSATMTASIGYNQKALAFRDAYKDLLEQDIFSVGFSVPLFRWGAGSAAVDAAIADQRRVEASVVQQRHDFDQEVLYQAARLNLLQRQVAVAAKSDTIAQRRFNVAKERYVIGKIDIPILFIAQSEKDAARRANYQTMWDYWATHYRVRRLALYDFGAGASLVAED
jgi:outer membrane protein TolC